MKITDIITESPGPEAETCPNCGGMMYEASMMNEKQDACYYKVKSRYKVWPSAYASGALVKCRKKGAKNWGNKSESVELPETELMAEDLRKWFKEKWVRFGPDGKIRGDCARGSDSEGKPKCLPQSKAHSLGKKGRASAASRKRREDPNANRSGKANNVATKNESQVLDKHFGTDPGPEVAYDKQEIRSLLTQAMGKLPARLERVLRMRYFQNMTLQQIGDKYGLTRNTIRQIEARALRMLKHPSKVGDTLKGSTAAYAEAANPAQHAAIAIAKKKSGKYDKDGERIREGGETGPKFTGYWKGTDKGKPGNKMVGDA
jgi:RNA polymerase sigma factor (sigma-70 family)